MANPRKPTQLKVIAGTDQKCRRPPSDPVNLPTIDHVPPAPDWLPNAHAIKEWNHLAPILVANKLLTLAGLSALGQLCSLHGKIVQLYAAGEAPSASQIGTLRNLMNDFGLTPVAQGKVSRVGDMTDPANKFAGNGKRP